MDRDKDTTHNDEPRDDARTIRWDDVTIGQEALHMPADLREDYAWLKSFVRDVCMRDIDLLMERFKELGIHRDKTTWAKILRGRYQRDMRGAILKTPVLAAEKFKEEVEALRNNIRIESMRGLVPFVETTTWDIINDAINARRETSRVNKWLIVVGPTGAQKTACFREYTLRNNHGMTKHVEAPERGTFGEFIRQLARAYGLNAKGNFIDCRQKVFQALGTGTASDRAKRCLIIDNAQELWQGDRDSDQPAFTFLRRLQDTTGCTIVLSITPLFEKKLVTGMIEGWFEQIEGRSGGRDRWIKLPEHAPEEDVLRIAKAFGLQQAAKHAKELVAISRLPGRIRRLFEDLQEGKILASAEKAPFTIEHVREARGI